MRVSVFYLHGGGGIGAIIALLLSLMPTTDADADDEKDGERKLTPR